MLVGTAKECKSVGQAGSDHADLVEEVCRFGGIKRCGSCRLTDSLLSLLAH